MFYQCGDLLGKCSLLNKNVLSVRGLVIGKCSLLKKNVLSVRGPVRKMFTVEEECFISAGTCYRKMFTVQAVARAPAASPPPLRCLWAAATTRPCPGTWGTPSHRSPTSPATISPPTSSTGTASSRYIHSYVKQSCHWGQNGGNS